MGRRNNSPDLILEKALEGKLLSGPEQLKLLTIKDSDLLERLFETARRVREKYFGNSVFLYGFLYINTYCRNSCQFCLYRGSNRSAPRYRKTKAEIVESAQMLAASGVHLIDLTLGEDPALFDKTDGFDPLIDILERVIESVKLPVMISPGCVPAAILKQLAETGIRWFACYQETYNRDLFDRLRKKQNFDRRMEIKLAAQHLGLLVEDGLLCGVGESDRDLLEAVATMGLLGVDQIRVMTFVPQPGTPMGDRSFPDPLRELKTIALMRLCFPQLLIPATLDIRGRHGLRRRLDAGANVVTSIVPSGRGLAGVAQDRLDIETGGRTVDGIREILEACGLSPAGPNRYGEWMHRRCADREGAVSKVGDPA